MHTGVCIHNAIANAANTLNKRVISIFRPAELELAIQVCQKPSIKIINFSVTKKPKGMNMSAYVNRYKRVFLWKKSRFLLYQIGDKPKTLQIVFLLLFKLDELGKFYAVELLDKTI